MKSLALLTAVAAAAATLAATQANAATDPARTLASIGSLAHQVSNLRQGIAWHRTKTWRYQDAAGVSRTRTEYAERHTRSVAFLGWMNRLWSQRRVAAKKLAARHPVVAHYALWMCIHSGEGAWNANTGNGYLGGLQMTPGWGGVARPDLLTPYQQMALAEGQYRASHYSTAWLGQQWPNTSPPCLSLA